MADRYQNRPYPSDDYDRGDDQNGRAESDPLAELARLIGQTDPFGAQQGRPAARPPAPPAPEPYRPPAQSYAPHSYEDHYEEPPPPPGPPSWMRRANVQPQPAVPERPSYAPAVNPMHPLQRTAAQQPAPEPDYQGPQAYPEHDDPIDPSRYDDALYGQLEAGQQDFQRDPSYPDDPYAYQSDYPEDELEDETPRKKRGGFITVAAILALAVVGTGGAFAYKTYLGSPRSGEPPIIKADNTPTKVVPAPADGTAKVPDRMAAGDGGEKIVPREEAPIDVNAKSGGPRVVFPPLNPNANPPSVASVSPSAVPPPAAAPAPNNGTMPNSEPRRIKTLAVKGDQTDSTPAPAAAAAKSAGAPKAAAAPAAPRNPPTSANASASQPMSLAPQEAPAPVAGQKMAATTPTQFAPASSGAGGGYVVQVSSQQSEESAHASYRVLQSKYGSVLGSRSPVVKRVDLTEKGKGIVYRAYAGPFGSQDEATQVCNNLKSAGLPQCFVQRN
ncbi:SPOR domain-containing protein [Bradyrhizobium sp. CB82]|uniref:SPOR domain-containing protein n=1 Tax=Bradyrhizobium sp. CB82 TaxID=3039159 RepID=UPI0024B1D5B3|nr:SPOR domain-containing protein [Bradyrhizobium sp. CB82]WFU45114.1 SPOR domain-containing protein [Bradyrhizobium sp. CB82]